MYLLEDGKVVAVKVDLGERFRFMKKKERETYRMGAECFVVQGSSFNHHVDLTKVSV